MIPIPLEKKSWLYYLLDFRFVINDEHLYQYIRQVLYTGRDFDEVDLNLIINNKKPLSDKSVVYSFLEWKRDKKIDEIIN